jgi:hypothetical protein
MTRCRSCRAPIVWLHNERTRKRAPIDADPSADGNVLVDRTAGTYRTLGPDGRDHARAEGVALHTNHFSTCPQSASWAAKSKQKASTP